MPCLTPSTHENITAPNNHYVLTRWLISHSCRCKLLPKLLNLTTTSMMCLYFLLLKATCFFGCCPLAKCLWLALNGHEENFNGLMFTDAVTQANLNGHVKFYILSVNWQVVSFSERFTTSFQHIWS